MSNRDDFDSTTLSYVREFTGIEVSREEALSLCKEPKSKSSVSNWHKLDKEVNTCAIEEQALKYLKELKANRLARARSAKQRIKQQKEIDEAKEIGLTRKEYLEYKKQRAANDKKLKMERNKKIYEMWDSGKVLRDIVKEVGLTKRAIHYIIKKRSMK